MSSTLRDIPETSASALFNKRYVVLTFDELESRVSWGFILSTSELRVLQEEVKHYNNQIELVCNGLAPSSCYKDSEVPDEIYLASNKTIEYGYAGFERPGARYAYEMKHAHYRFDLYIFNPNSFLEEKNDEDIDDEYYLKGKYLENEGSSRDLKDLLLNRFDSCDCFSIGYRLLPLTRRLIDSLESNLIGMMNPLEFYQFKSLKMYHEEMKKDLNSGVMLPQRNEENLELYL